MEELKVEVILTEHVPNLGEMGETVRVSDGYARNYLIPRKLAVSLYSASAKKIEHEMRAIRKREEKVRVKLQAVAKKMEDETVEIKARAGQEDKLFGSVTSANIAEALKEKGYEVDRKTVDLEEPIKRLGVYSVPVRLGSGVIADVKVWVVSDQPEPGPEAEAEAEAAPEGEAPEAAAAAPAEAEAPAEAPGE
jgi:large subunit ribosomal protein L9